MATLPTAHRRNPALRFGVMGLAVLVFLALFGPQLSPKDPLEMREFIEVNGKRQYPPFPPSREFPLGTDSVGRDILSGLLAGSRYTLLFTALAVGLSLCLAVPLGLVAGLGGRWLRSGVEALAAGVSAIPPVLAAGLLLQWTKLVGRDWPIAAQILFTAGVWAALNGARLAEVVRRFTVQIRAEPYVEAAVAAGATPGRVMFKHVLPNLSPALVTTALLESASFLRMLALLGVLRIFISPTSVVELPGGGIRTFPLLPDWSSYLAFPFGSLRTSYWILLFPGLMLAFSVMVLQALAEGLRKKWSLR